MIYESAACPARRGFVNVPPNSFTDQSFSVEQIIPLSGKNLVRRRARHQMQSRLRGGAASATGCNYANARVRISGCLMRTRSWNLTKKSYVIASDRGGGSFPIRSRPRTAADALPGKLKRANFWSPAGDLPNISADQSQLNVLMNRDAFAPLGQPEQAQIKLIVQRADGDSARIDARESAGDQNRKGKGRHGKIASGTRAAKLDSRPGGQS